MLVAFSPLCVTPLAMSDTPKRQVVLDEWLFDWKIPSRTGFFELEKSELTSASNTHSVSETKAVFDQSKNVFEIFKQATDGEMQQRLKSTTKGRKK
jgi:hypothetical protein